MTSRDFAYWLQGLFELSDVTTLNEKQTDLIRRHLALVFIHEIDPSMGDKLHQDKLTQVHHTPWDSKLFEPSLTTGKDMLPKMNC